jgi:hypothetical protein
MQTLRPPSADRSGRSAWPDLAPGLSPDSIKQKYAQIVVSTRIVPGCVLFLGGGKTFLHSLDPQRTLRGSTARIASVSEVATRLLTLC